MAWEYLHWNSEAPIEHSQLNTFGAQGWELVSVVFSELSEHGWFHHYYFKRPLGDESDISDESGESDVSEDSDE